MREQRKDIRFLMFTRDVDGFAENGSNYAAAIKVRISISVREHRADVSFFERLRDKYW